MPYLSAKDVELDEFLNIVEAQPWPENPLIIGYAPAEAVFMKYSFDRIFLSKTEQGRIFQPNGELQWRKIDHRVRMVYLGHGPSPEVLDDYSYELKDLSSSRRKVFLWGERTVGEDEWLEQQVPHRFKYPIETHEYNDARATIIIEDWVSRAGMPYFSRYHSCVEVKGGS